MQEPVLVTGAAGFIGSHVVLALKDAGWQVAGLDSLATGYRWAVPDGVRFYQGDLADKALVEQVLRDQGIGNGVGAIFHCAGTSNGPSSLAKPLDFYANNTAKSCALLCAAVDAEVPHFIFSSTAAVYGYPDQCEDYREGAALPPVNEDCPCRPLTPFASSKMMTEIMLADAARAYPFNYCALRYFDVVGADPSGRSGQSAEGSPHLIKVAVEAALGKRAYVSVFGTDYPTRDGTAVRDFIHVSDLAQAHVLALEALMADHCRSLTLNCGYGRGFSVLEVLDTVERLTGRKIERRMEPPRTATPDSLVADNARIMATLPWRPEHTDLDSIIHDALAWERRLATIRGT